MDVENSSEFRTPAVVDSPQAKEIEQVDIDGEDEIFVAIPKTPKTPCTPSNSNGLSPGSSATNTPQSATKKRKRLTPQEREEREKERAEKRLKLEEEKLKKDEEKRKREEERLAKLEQKEQDRLKREEEKRKKQEEIDRKNKEKEDEKRRKQEEDERKKKEKEDEKRQKEEERLKKAEERERERLKREQEKQQKLEEKEREKKKEEEKIAKQAMKFTSFFQKSPAICKSTSSAKRLSLTKVGDVSQQQSGGQSDVSFDDADASSDSSKSQINLLFNPMMFEVKSNMAVAPLLRRSKMTLADIQNLDRFGFSSTKSSKTTTMTSTEDQAMEIDLTEDSCEPITLMRSDDAHNNYLVELKKNKNGRFGRGYGRTEMSDRDIDVQFISTKIIENPSAQGLVKWRYKLLQFHDNQRPAYWGTWKKQSLVAKPRKPWGQEKDMDYEFDSDDEWEEEPEDAEDLASSDKEEDPADNAEEEEDDEDGWLVPHGYISDDEGAEDEHEHLDKEALKLQEKNYFEGLNKQIKIHLPEIQTERLSDFRLVFSPLMKKWKEMSAALQTISVQPVSSVRVGVTN